MSAPKIILLVWFALAALTVIANIGKKREPATPSSAVIALILSGVLATLVVLA